MRSCIPLTPPKTKGSREERKGKEKKTRKRKRKGKGREIGKRKKRLHMRTE